jgi:hypothetical protein
MNTFNLINAIALVACILTPTYVLYFLKYHIKQEQKHQKKMIDVLDAQLCDHSIVINKIQTDSLDDFEKRQEQLKEINHNIEKNDVKFKMFKSVAENTFDNINVQQNYLRRTLDNESVELKKSMQFVIERLESIEASHIHFKQTTSESIKKLNSQVDSLQSLNITTQNILKRINSKEFTTELVREWIITLNKEKKEKEELESLKSKSKVGRPRKDKQEEVKQTKPTESVVSEVVNIIKDKEPASNEEIVQEKKLRTPKSESKRRIRTRELEQFFKERTKLTYRGYVIKYGEEAFKREKNLVYKRLYYQKFQRPLLMKEEYVQSQLAFNKTNQ